MTHPVVDDNTTYIYVGKTENGLNTIIHSAVYINKNLLFTIKTEKAYIVFQPV